MSLFLKSIVLGSLLFSVPANSVVQKVDNHHEQQINCLAENIYHEARGQPTKGKIAVSNVVINRTKSGKFPSTPCAVIKQRSKKGCQFSWVCTKRRILDSIAYLESKRIARQVYYHEVGDVTNGALYFNTGSRKYSMRIGAHSFYRG